MSTHPNTFTKIKMNTSPQAELLDSTGYGECPEKGLLTLIRINTYKYVRLDELDPGEMFVVSTNAAAPWVVLDDRNRQSTLIANLFAGEQQRLANNTEVLRVKGNLQWWVL